MKPSNDTRLALDDRSALKEMIVVATPAVASMLSFSMMQFVDRLLTAQMIGPEALGAAGNGGIASWVPAAVMMGILGVINTFVSQNLGAGRPERGPAYAWAGIWLSVAVWCVVLLPYALFFPQVFAAMRSVLQLPTVSEHVQRMESIYGSTLLLGMVLSLSARALGHYFYGMHRPGIVLLSTITGNALNLIVSYSLIRWSQGYPELGSEGMAELGIWGAAIGTLAGVAVECAIPLFIFLSPRSQRLYGTRSAWKPSLARIRDIFRIGWPGGVMFGNEMVCWWIFMGGFVASFDKGSDLATHNPAGWITHQYLMLSFMPAVGISIAVTAIVGKCIGAGRHDLAQARTWMGVKVTLVYMGICALCFVLFGSSMARLFLSDDVTPEQGERIVELAKWMLVLAATFQLFDGAAITVSGALRGAGDTVWPGIVTIFLSWGVIVGGGWLLITFAPALESYGPWIAASLYVILLSLALLWRFRSGYWRTIRILDSNVSEAVEGGKPVLASDPGPGPIGMAPGLDIPDLSVSDQAAAEADR